ncbi:MAG: NUDIX hydrolase [Emcibacter sp.]|nr:NUDIX hydrolase [Emcibacter sp.]
MNEMLWKKLKSENVYENERGIVVEKQKVQLPDGTVLSDYYQIKMRNFVTMVIQDEQHRFLCLKQYKHGMGKVGLTLPGGIIEEDEGPLETAARELMEETGYVCSELRSMGKYVLSGNQHICYSHIIGGYGAKMISVATNPDQENGKICFMAQKEIRKALIANDFLIISHALALDMALANS